MGIGDDNAHGRMIERATDHFGMTEEALQMERTRMQNMERNLRFERRLNVEAVDDNDDELSNLTWENVRNIGQMKELKGQPVLPEMKVSGET